ncbi:multiple inositol polyphosphate phosphatase 1-like [Contarinia nasturtii]|uniref:multiple inositol polyphosphate phosphatase 1-like n=1 Tax=Contarinia nasturtii TaxID=265458 RepID=UPI0012D41273|nr:multiple inositol polyphosphate phosphatase 1-like [Contarinia nasturtii]
MRNFVIIFLILAIEILVTAQDFCRHPLYFEDELKTCDQNDFCFSLDEDRIHTKYFSTKTAYRTEKSRDKRHDFEIEDCTPSNVWLLIRHGTRLTTAKGIKRFSQMEKFRDEIVKNAEKLPNLPLCQEDWKLLKSWKWNNSITENQGNNLVTQGFNELRTIAHNFKQNIPNLFSPPYDISTFHFRHTNTERTHSSFGAFFDGIFGDNTHKMINARSPSNRPDLLLKAYANCPLWIEQKKKLKQSDSEVKKFENSMVFKKMIEDIDSRLGFDGTLQMRSVKDIYDMCRYEQAWQTDKASSWCSLLTPSQVYLLEYLEDLNYFYKSSHGSKLNKNIKCFAMKDMLRRLSDDNKPKTTVYFSHSAAVQLFLTSLEAMKDDVNLTAENFAKSTLRKWRTSRVSPFAANVAVVRYKCPLNDKVKFFLNENVLHFDWCTENGVCDWNDVQEKYAFYAHTDCNKVFCSNQL